MKNPLLSFALAAAIFAISSGNVANAFQIGDFYQNAEVIKANSVKVVNESLIKVNTTIKGYGANSPYAIKTVDVPKTSFMSHVRTNMRSLVKKNAWYAAWFAAMAAAGWAINELTGQVTAVNNSWVGSCMYGNPLIVHPVTVELTSCAKIALSGQKPNTTFISYRYYYGSTEVAAGKNATYLVAYTSQSGTQLEDVSFKFTYRNNDGRVEEVSEDAIYESLMSKMLQDPVSAAQAFMVPDAYPYPYPHIFPDPVKYIPGVSESDEALLDALIKGQLQTTNPNAPGYVTPEKMQQLQGLLSQLQQGLTPEGQVGSANDKLKDALTQAQLEETIKKEKEKEEKAVKDALGEKPSFDKLTEPLDKFVENVNKTPQDEINPLPQNTFGIAGSGTCYLIQKPISIMGVTVDMSTRSFCDAYYYPYFLPILTWFFYIATGLYIWFSLRDAYSRRI